LRAGDCGFGGRHLLVGGRDPDGRPRERGLGRHQSAAGLGLDDGLLRVSRLGLRLGQRKISLGLGQPGVVVGGVDLEQHVAGVHGLVVLHVDFDHGSPHPRRHGNDVGFDLRVVGALVVARDEQVDANPQQGHTQNDPQDHEGFLGRALLGLGGGGGRLRQ
jgi:hypothetical protein